MSAVHHCKQCGRSFVPKRPHQKYDHQECRYQGWIQQQVEAARQRVEEHPLAEVRADQEATDLKSKLSQIIYEGIVDRLRFGPVHADDLEPLFPPEVRDVCRRLVGAQFGSLASRRFIVERERRKSSVPSRKGAKSGVFEFTKLGREKLIAGVDVGRGATSREAADSDAEAAGIHPGDQSAAGVDSEHREGSAAKSYDKPSGTLDRPAPFSSGDPSGARAAVDPGGAPDVTSQASGGAARTLSLLPEVDPEAWAA
jgi:hypothetical protein